MQNKKKTSRPYQIAVIVTDADRKIQWVNDGFTEITAYDFDEVIGKKPGLILQGEGSDADAIERIRKCLDMEIPFQDEITNYRKNGEEYKCKLTIHPIFNNDQKLTNFIAFEVDGDVIPETENVPLLRIRKKYLSSGLDEVKAVDLYFQLLNVMEEDRIYLDPNLKLKMLADRLSTNSKYLSQVINKHTGNNFLHFINKYRVEEAKKKIVDNQYAHLTTFGVALQCGFKNKSTFYKVFREHTGITPNDYIKQDRLRNRKSISPGSISYPSDNQ